MWSIHNVLQKTRNYPILSDQKTVNAVAYIDGIGGIAKCTPIWEDGSHLDLRVDVPPCSGRIDLDDATIGEIAAHLGASLIAKDPSQNIQALFNNCFPHSYHGEWMPAISTGSILKIVELLPKEGDEICLEEPEAVGAVAGLLLQAGKAIEVSAWQRAKACGFVKIIGDLPKNGSFVLLSYGTEEI